MRFELAGTLIRPEPLVLRIDYTRSVDIEAYRDLGYTVFDVICIGAGGGRGGGIDTGNTGTLVRSYGGEGGGGGLQRVQGLLSALPSSVAVVVGAAGAAGQDNTSDATQTTDGGDGGASSFNGNTCRASGGKGGKRVQANSLIVSAEAAGGDGGIGGRTLAGGGALGGIAGEFSPDYGPPNFSSIVLPGTDGADGTWNGSIGSGGGGGAGGIGKYGSGGIALILATSGGRGSYNPGDLSVYGVGSSPTDDINTGTIGTVPGQAGGAKASILSGFPSIYGSSGKDGNVIIRLMALVGDLSVSTPPPPLPPTGPVAPQCIILPVISAGIIEIDNTLTCTHGVWTGDEPITYAYQWKIDGAPIVGETSNTYGLVPDDTDKLITCTITATNVVGSISATAVGIVAPAPPAPVVPANTTLPSISGTVQVDNMLTCDPGIWTGTTPITYTYQWKKNGTPIGGEVSSTYIIVSGDAGATITCTVTATNSAGSDSATSAGVTPPAPAQPANTVLPSISGIAEVDNILSCTQGTWTGTSPITYTYQWKQGGTPIIGATSDTYLLVNADAGTTITCTVTATNSAGSVSATSTGVAIAIEVVGTLKFSSIGNDLAPFAATNPPGGTGIRDHSNQADYTGSGGLSGCQWGTVTRTSIGGKTCFKMDDPEQRASYALCSTEVAVGATGPIGDWDACGPYFGKAFYVPPEGFLIPGANHYTIIYKSGTGMGDSGTTSVPGSAYSVALYVDRLEAHMTTGAFSGSFEHSGTFIIIPVGFFAANLGKWISYITRYKWESDHTGEVQTWYRAEGGSWIDNGLQWSGKPTAVWAADRVAGPLAHGDPGHKGLHCAHMNYCWTPPVGTGHTIVYERDFHVGDTFNVVAAMLP